MMRALLGMVVGVLLGCGAASAQPPAGDLAQTVEQLRKTRKRCALTCHACRRKSRRCRSDRGPHDQHQDGRRSKGDRGGDRRGLAGPVRQEARSHLTEIQAVNKARPTTSQPSRPRRPT